MKKFEKRYIGKARQVDGLEIIKVSLKVSDIVKFAHKYEGEDYISFEVARMQQPDKFGRQYTVYVSSLVEHEEQPGKEISTKQKTVRQKHHVKETKAD